MKERNFWINVSLLVCLIVGLAIYIISTYRSDSASNATQVTSPATTIPPILSITDPLSTTIKQGQTLTLHGEHFGAGNSVSFFLDALTPIKDKENQVLSVQASRTGTFDVQISLRGPEWTADAHFIQAIDAHTGQNSYLNIVVSPASFPVTTSRNLALSVQNKPVSKLTFHATAGQDPPASQRITITNISPARLHWAVTANTQNNLDWLGIDSNHIAGTLDRGGKDSITVSVLTKTLKSNRPAAPYTGQILFTINSGEQLALPVELQVTDTPSEIAFAPNPALAPSGPGNSCRNASVTLINLGNAFTHWTLVPYTPDARDRIQFLTNGQSVMQGDLAASGTPGNTQVLNLQCNRVSAGENYKFTLYVGAKNWPVTIVIQ
jgi:hypothetical protein